MDYSKIKLIISDMDGTLLNSRHEVSSRFFKAFQQLKQNNIQFAVASGRQYYSLRERMEPVKEEMIYIAENGAIVIQDGEEQHLVPMKMELVEQLIKEVRELGNKYLILCGRKQAYIENDAPEFMEPFLNHYEKYLLVDDLLAVKDDVILKVTICDLQGAEENSLPHVEHFKKELQVKLSGEIWIDFNDLEAQKGNALKALQKKLGITKEETMAFGDYLNDLELFEHAAIGFAVENAHAEVKQAAEYTTSSNDNFGVEVILEDLLKKKVTAQL
ncbi:HAD family hydrolase [Salinimicrobium oceani]|uniref:HAD family hydrolase n=1 Tax=Salinimicrobium oceani TaxID=2722702 RepID=A0ABX1D296_9FLAO|nr:HAD family hydrolase [Salinimicrobium oceani]NJW53304.1 HAD family hydrolase [Salinimicrobium oceani]